MPAAAESGAAVTHFSIAPSIEIGLFLHQAFWLSYNCKLCPWKTSVTSRNTRFCRKISGPFSEGKNAASDIRKGVGEFFI